MIFYYSGTGNTKWAALELSRRLGGRLCFIPEALSIPGGSHADTCDYYIDREESVGFCFPVHGWQPPHIVRDFVARLRLFESDGSPLSSRHYVYALVTCGDETGLTMELFQRCLEAVGLPLHGRFALVMPETYVCLPFMHTDTKERERMKLSQAASDLEEIIHQISGRTPVSVAPHRGSMPWLLSHLFGAFFNRFMITDRPFRVDASRCTRCGLCARSCSVHNIRGGSGLLPEFLHTGRCTCCLSCYHHCPRHAINYGRITERRGQYYLS